MLKTLLLAAKTDSVTDKSNSEIVQTWLESKKIKDSDLVFAKTLKTQAHWNQAYLGLLKIAQLKLSYSEGLKFFEIICDLILMGKFEDLNIETTDQQIWKNNILKIRYPETSQSDENLKSKLENLPWPYGSKIKFERRGDRAGVELKMFITSQADLTKALSALERVKEQL